MREIVLSHRISGNKNTNGHVTNQCSNSVSCDRKFL